MLKLKMQMDLMHCIILLWMIFIQPQSNLLSSKMKLKKNQLTLWEEVRKLWDNLTDIIGGGQMQLIIILTIRMLMITSTNAYKKNK